MDSVNPSRSLSRRGFVGATAGIGAAGLLGRVTVTRVVEFSGPPHATGR